MERTARRDWFACPRCGTHAEQWWLTTDRPRPRTRWSTCAACRRITVWRGPLIAHPPASLGLPARGAAHLADASGDVVSLGLRRLWEALRLHLLELEIAAQTPGARD